MIHFQCEVEFIKESQISRRHIVPVFPLLGVGSRLPRRILVYLSVCSVTRLSEPMYQEMEG